ncbi:hypothetical protein ACTHP3_18550 [Shouchella rhizosphaerae]|uniref:hypothetical protein n=1 Tax=Shouchella rhizosphaerae TaxID=866786 RepID=UPI003F7F3D3A
MYIPFSKEQLLEEVLDFRKENRELKEALREVNRCIDDFYTKEDPRRLCDAPLSAFSGQIQVMDKVSSLTNK